MLNDCNFQAIGFHNMEGNATLHHCAFSGVGEHPTHVALQNDAGQVSLTRCVFRHNAGTGLYNGAGSDAVVEDCEFVGHWSAVTNDSGSATIAHSLFAGNVVHGSPNGMEGGGIRNLNSNSTITNCIFVANGPAIWNDASAVTVADCTFAGNWAGFFCCHSTGTAIRNWWGSNASTINCLFVDNSDVDVSNNESSTTMSNCTLVSTTTRSYGSAVTGYLGCSTVSNSIMRGYPDAIFHWDGEESVTNVLHCNVEGGWPGPGSNNIDVDPLFVPGLAGTWTADPTVDTAAFQTTFLDAEAAFKPGELVGKFVTPEVTFGRTMLIAANTATTVTVWGDLSDYGYAAEDSYEIYDFHLSDGSPCIDAGHNNAIADLADTDLDGNPRFADDPATGDTGCGVPVVVDMGAFEFQGEPATVLFGDLDGNGRVGIRDLVSLIQCMGSDEPACCVADLDLDGEVGMSDVMLLIHMLVHSLPFEP
jgi:hypothetical protein